MPDDSTVDEKEPMSQTEELITAQAPTIKKEEKEKKKKKKARIFRGLYHNQSSFYVIYRGDKDYWDGPFLSSNEDIDPKKLPKDVKTSTEDLDTVVGLWCVVKEYVSLSRPDSENSVEGYNEVRKMLESCGQDPAARQAMLTLFSTVLSGYCTGFCQKFYPQKPFADNKRAPIVIIKNYTRPLVYFLNNIMESLAVKLIPEKKKELSIFRTGRPEVKIEYKPCVMVRSEKKDITDHIYMKIEVEGAPRISEKRLIPQYRDMTLMVDLNGFKESQLQELIGRNPWVSFVLLEDKAKGRFTESEMTSIDGNIFSGHSGKWDNEIVNFVVQRYISYVAHGLVEEKKKEWKEKIEEKLENIALAIEEYNKKSNAPVQGDSCYFLSMRMIALDLFLTSLYKDAAISEEDRDEIRREWFDILLSAPIQNDASGEESRESPLDIKRQLENALREMIAPPNYKHFLFVPDTKKALYPMALHDGDETAVWGYVRTYNPKNQEPPFLSLQFRRDMFLRLVGASFRQNETELIKSIRGLNLDYIYPIDKCRMYANEEEKKNKTTTSAIVFILEKMTFLPNEALEFLRGMAEEENDPEDA